MQNPLTEILCGLLDNASKQLRSGECRLSDVAMTEAIRYARHLTEPSNNVETEATFARKLHRTTRTLRNWLKIGVIPKPHKIQGLSANIWYTDEVEQAKKKLKETGFL